jgi:hypothetical protein
MASTTNHPSSMNPFKGLFISRGVSQATEQTQAAPRTTNPSTTASRPSFLTVLLRCLAAFAV